MTGHLKTSSSSPRAGLSGNGLRYWISSSTSNQTMIDIKVLPDGRTVTYTAEVEEEVIEEEEDIEITGSRVMTTCRKENNQQVETVSRLTEGEVIKVTRTNSRSSYSRAAKYRQISDLRYVILD